MEGDAINKKCPTFNWLGIKKWFRVSDWLSSLSAPPSQGITAENSSQKRSSFAGSEHCWAPRPAAEADGSRTGHRRACHVGPGPAAALKPWWRPSLRAYQAAALL